MSPALRGLLPALPVASRLLSGAPRLVPSSPRYSEGRQECPSRVWYCPDTDPSKFKLHIRSDTAGGFQWLKYILLMIGNATRHLGEGKPVILCSRVRGSVRTARAVRNMWVFLTETWVVAHEITWNDNVHTPISEWLSAECQRFLVLHHWYSAWQPVDMIHKFGNGWRHQKRASLPLQAPFWNWASTERLEF